MRRIRSFDKIEELLSEKGKERTWAYYKSLGRFVAIFAIVEANLSSTLWFYAKTKPEIAKILFSGVRVDVGSTYIKQLAKVTKVKKKHHDELNDVLQQLAAINKVRNVILHHGTKKIASGRGIASDAFRAKGAPTSFRISSEVLDEMTEDLIKIIVHLRHCHLGVSFPRKKSYRSLLEAALQSPWRYKRPSQMKSLPKRAAKKMPKGHVPEPPPPPQS
jgi:hypothetical protein